MTRSKTREVIAEILHPIRHNDLEKRRLRLGLSRAALARILDVDPATVFRQERERVMTALWDYALCGIEAEAKLAKSELQSHQAHVDSRDLIPDAMTARGYRYTGEKMKAQKPRPAAKPRRVVPPAPTRSPRPQMPSQEAVKAIADRAEARSRAGRNGTDGS